MELHHITPRAAAVKRLFRARSLEFQLSDRQERQLIDAGMMPVSALPYSPDMVFGAVRSLQAPATYAGPNAPAAEASARLSSQINSILCASRFAHLLKVMGRDMVGSMLSADDIERRLKRWLQGYVNGNLNSTGETRARFPLVDGDVEVREHPDRPGVFGCVMRLQPHYQLDDVASIFTLVTDFVTPGSKAT
jgi:type VI secretion system protein ImpD/type VI secretion system protein ImpC